MIHAEAPLPEREASGSQNPSGKDIMRFIMSPGYAIPFVCFAALMWVGISHRDSSSSWLTVAVIATVFFGIPVIPLLPIAVIAYAGVILAGLAGIIADAGRFVGNLLGASHGVKAAPENRRASVDRQERSQNEHDDI